MGSPRLACDNDRHPSPKAPVGLAGLKAKMTEQIGWLEKQLYQAACVSEDLKHWEAWDNITGAKPTTPHSQSSGGEKPRQKAADDDLPLDGWGKAAVNQTNIGTVSKATLGNFWETWRSAYGLLECSDITSLNWTGIELNWIEPQQTVTFKQPVKSHLPQQQLVSWCCRGGYA